MKRITLTVSILIWFSWSAHTMEDVAFSRNSARVPQFLSFIVPSEYHTIQSAIDAAARSKGKELTIIVEEGIYRESVVAYGISNLKLIGKKARILPPVNNSSSESSKGGEFQDPAFRIVDCENFIVDGFTFIGDDFTAHNPGGFPVSSAVHAINSSGTISNNIIFNYLDGIVFQVDDPRWRKGQISDNYIHNCLWSGIFATGSHSLKIHQNKITFTIPKELSISVGIWTIGGMGIITGNLISSYRYVDFINQRKPLLGSDIWPLNFPVGGQTDYQVVDNIFEQSAKSIQTRSVGNYYHEPPEYTRYAMKVNSYFVNVDHNNQIPRLPEIVLLTPW